MAADVLSSHFAVAGGRFVAAMEEDVGEGCDLHRWDFFCNSKTWCRQKGIDVEAALCRWAFAKLGTRFNKCERNPVNDHPFHHCSAGVHLITHDFSPLKTKQKRTPNRGRRSQYSPCLLAC